MTASAPTGEHRTSPPRLGMAGRLTGALLLGVGTLLMMKPDPREHWATPPVVQVVAVSEDAGDPDEPFDRDALAPVDTAALFPEPSELLGHAAVALGVRPVRVRSPRRRGLPRCGRERGR